MRRSISLALLLLVTSILRSQQTVDHPDMLGDHACSSFCLGNNGYAVFGANYDLAKKKDDGLVIVNKRHVSKDFQRSDSAGQHVRWTSRYGSVSFNFVASQTSWTGMNEAGLVVYSMRLEEGSRAPKPDRRSPISAHFWLQYMLDRFSTIEEVVASDSLVRIFSPDRIPHYLVSDRYGNCATVEFIDGRTVVHYGKTLPVAVLANTAYAASIAEWKGAASSGAHGKPGSPKRTASRSRFLRGAERVAAFTPTDAETAVATAFDILRDMSDATTNWSIVYDAKRLRVHFKTRVHPAIRVIDFYKLDFSCQSPVKMLDVNERLSGDITERLKDYAFSDHLAHALKAARTYELAMTPEQLKTYILDVDSFQCADASRQK